MSLQPEEKWRVLSGALYVIATPLGNLGDLSERAISVLSEVELIACEDTRRTGSLLKHLGIKSRLKSLNKFNEESRIDELLQRIAAGDKIALVSDAGTPCLSDPGERLVKRVANEGLTLVPLPGPSAPITLLSVAGFGGSDFRFIGFAPRENSKRQQLFEAQRYSESALVFFESPKRILKVLESACEVLALDTPLCIGRELTKLHEEILHGTLGELFEELTQRDKLYGEFTVAIEAGREERTAAEDAEKWARALLAKGLSRRDTRDLLVEMQGLGSRDAYKLVLEFSESGD